MLRFSMLPVSAKLGVAKQTWRMLRALGIAGGFAFCLGTGSATAASSTEIRVPIVGVRNDAGTIFVALYEQSEWLKPHRFVRYQWVKAHRGSVYAAFHGVPTGRYGIAVFHDENRNGQVDTNVLGLPKEGYGFSRITPRRKPSFDEVAFEVKPLGHAHVQMRY